MARVKRSMRTLKRGVKTTAKQYVDYRYYRPRKRVKSRETNLSPYVKMFAGGIEFQ